MLKLVPECAHPDIFLLHGFFCNFTGFAEPNDIRNIFSTGPYAAFLVSACNYRLQICRVADKYRAYTFGRM